MGEREEFVHRHRGGGYAIAVLLMIFPAMLLAGLLEHFAGIRQGPAPAAVIVGLAVVAYFVAGGENRLVIDERAVRFTRSSFLFGVRRGERVEWELPLGAVASVREVTTRTPSGRGGWNTSVVLHFTEDHRLHERDLGMKGAPSGAYDPLVASLRRRLGERFTTERVT